MKDQSLLLLEILGSTLHTGSSGRGSGPHCASAAASCRRCSHGPTCRCRRVPAPPRPAPRPSSAPACRRPRAAWCAPVPGPTSACCGNPESESGDIIMMHWTESLQISLLYYLSFVPLRQAPCVNFPTFIPRP